MAQQETLVPNALLAEIGKFLDQTLASETLSETTTSQRKYLQQRLWTFLPNNDPYLDMIPKTDKGRSAIVRPQNGTVDRDQYVVADTPVTVEEVYEECPNQSQVMLRHHSPEQEDSGAKTLSLTSEDPAYSQTAANVLRGKVGPLLRREKVFLTNKFRKYWVGILECHLLFYGSEKDLKPASAIHLIGLEARPIPAPARDLKKKGAYFEKDAYFELVCPGRKTVQLVARTEKDMIQWIRVVNQASCLQPDIVIELPTRRQLPSIPDDDCSDTYDDVEHDDIQPSHSDSVESLYDDIGEIYPDSERYHREKSDLEEVLTEPRPEVVSPPTSEPPPEEEEAFYDDIGTHVQTSTTHYPSIQQRPLPMPKPGQINNFHSKSENIIEKGQPMLATGEEKLYDSEHYHRAKSNLKKLLSKPRPEVGSPSTSEPPPEEEEAFYDDIGIHMQTSTTHYPSTPSKSEPPPEEEEAFYDDIGTHMQTSTTHYPSIQQQPFPTPKPGQINNFHYKSENIIDKGPPMLDTGEEELYDDIGFQDKPIAPTVRPTLFTPNRSLPSSVLTPAVRPTLTPNRGLTSNVIPAAVRPTLTPNRSLASNVIPAAVRPPHTPTRGLASNAMPPAVGATLTSNTSHAGSVTLPKLKAISTPNRNLSSVFPSKIRPTLLPNRNLINGINPPNNKIQNLIQQMEASRRKKTDEDQ